VRVKRQVAVAPEADIRKKPSDSLPDAAASEARCERYLLVDPHSARSELAERDQAMKALQSVPALDLLISRGGILLRLSQ
jgi:hypothetical protein